MYFGYILSPLISVVFSALTVLFEERTFLEKDVMKKFLYLLLIIRFSCVPVLYNYSIFLGGFFGTYIPIYVFNKINIKKYTW